MKEEQIDWTDVLDQLLTYLKYGHVDHNSEPIDSKDVRNVGLCGSIEDRRLLFIVKKEAVLDGAKDTNEYAFMFESRAHRVTWLMFKAAQEGQI